MSVGRQRQFLFADLQDYEGSLTPKFLTKPREASNSYITRDRAEHPKIDRLVEKVAAAVANRKKCLVFSAYLESGLYIIRDELRRRGISVAVYEGKLNAADKSDIVRRYNQGRISVILLSDAGKEGLDLKNTGEVHILEPQWNEEKVQQAIGRAVRYKSHDDSVPKHVDVYRYIAVFPEGWEELKKEWSAAQNPNRRGTFVYLSQFLIMMSADDALQRYTTLKHTDNRNILERLVRISDENLRNC
jgi:superfamily II DNA or RNA helicase